jgi:hypothetical protein
MAPCAGVRVRGGDSVKGTRAIKGFVVVGNGATGTPWSGAARRPPARSTYRQREAFGGRAAHLDEARIRHHPQGAAMRTIFGNVPHSVERYANNRAEVCISRPANGNGKCADSNPPGTPNGFSRSMMIPGTTRTRGFQRNRVFLRVFPRLAGNMCTHQHLQ